MPNLSQVVLGLLVDAPTMPRRTHRDGLAQLEKHFEDANRTAAGFAKYHKLKIDKVEGKASCWLLAVLANIDGALVNYRRLSLEDRTLARPVHQTRKVYEQVSRRFKGWMWFDMHHTPNVGKLPWSASRSAPDIEEAAPDPGILASCADGMRAIGGTPVRRNGTYTRTTCANG